MSHTTIRREYFRALSLSNRSSKLINFLSETDISELEDDDALVDDAVKMGAMHFFRQSVVASQHFHQEVWHRLIQEV